jgi:hypothetical protein
MFNNNTTQNIAPTLMIVRVGLGRTGHDTTEEQGRRASEFPRARPAAASTFEVRRVTSTVIDITAAHNSDARADILMTKLGEV